MREAAVNHFERKYKIIEKMGNGVYGAVYKVVQKGSFNEHSPDVTYYAAKKLFLKNPNQQ